jgi:site-specific DNA-adenine methylase
MNYVGSKRRVAKYIVPILQKCIDDNEVQVYIEPFVGGANIIDKITCKKRIGYDIHKELIAMFTALQNGWQPPFHISEETYNTVKENKCLFPEYLVGLVGFCASFGSKYFDGYARRFKNDKVTPRDKSNEVIRGLVNQMPKLHNVIFMCCDYLELDLRYLENAVIYCDPPYENATRYYGEKFSHEMFWNWARIMAKNNFVFVSEYNAPDDFTCIQRKSTTTTLNVVEHERKTEKLFVYSEGRKR